MSASSTFKLQPKDIDAMVAGLKKAASGKGFNFKGDKKSGTAAKNDVPPTIEYVVKDQTVTITIDTGGIDLDSFERMVKEWTRPYQ